MPSLEELVLQMRQKQVESVVLQQHVADSVNQALAGGISGVAQVAEALEGLRHQPSPAVVPTQVTSVGDTGGATFQEKLRKSQRRNWMPPSASNT